MVRKLQELPGQHLFQYVNGEGVPHPVTSADVNDYIRAATDGEFTAKHFRTWGASVIAFEKLLELEEAKRISVNTMIEPVAEALGNTVAISRKSYVHPGAHRGGEGQPARPAQGDGAAARTQMAVVVGGRVDPIPGQAAPEPKTGSLIGGAAPAKSGAMHLELITWLERNRDGLMLGLAVGAAIVAVMLVLRGLGRRTVERDPHGLSWRTVLGRSLARTSLAFMILAAADVVATYADLPRRAAHVIDILFVIAFALQGAVWGRELVLGVIGRRVAEDNGAGALSNAMAIIRVLVSVALFAIAGVLILDNLGVNVTALVAGLGIGGIAIGLAAQGIFSDLFAALAILFDKPFKRGDTIRYDGSTGTVERIGLKTTRLRSITGEQLIMANTKLLEREIHNLAQANARRMTLYFALAAKTPRHQARPGRNTRRRSRRRAQGLPARALRRGRGRQRRDRVRAGL